MGVSYIMSIEDSSSIINYHPQGDGGLGDLTQNGWQPFYATSGGFATRGGEAALGSSQHITAFPNASLDFQFYGMWASFSSEADAVIRLPIGTSVSLTGIANCSYDVSVDGKSRSFKAKGGQSTTLFSQDGLPLDTHTVSLTAHASNGSTFTFERADISRTIANNTQVPKPHVYQSTNTTLIQYSGNWTVLSDPLIPNMQHPAPYFEVSDPQASFSFSFQGVGVAINGSRIWGSYTYEVNLDGVPTTYNASTMWFIGDALLYYQDGLDPHTIHNITVSPVVGDGLKFWLNTVTVFTDDASEAGGIAAPSTPSATSTGLPQATSEAPATSSGSSKTNVGVIVGPVIGGVAFIALLAAFLWYFLRKRREAARVVFEREAPEPFVPAQAHVPSMPPMTFIPGDTKAPLSSGSGSYSREALPVLPMGATLSSQAPSETGQTVSDSPLLQSPGSAHSRTALVPANATSPTTTQADSPATATAAAASPTDSNAAVDRIIQMLAERIATHPADVPPPEYGA
ncbi:hypothetical protein C8Q77DRAFT_723656 [Trametes polyzona]|nr:hypothetical protein C8Q77DRAFT_723656 [Trametes polyzona]